MTLQITPTTLERPTPAPVDIYSQQINLLAKAIAALPVNGGWQQTRLVELFAALIAAYVSYDALYCALGEAAEDAEVAA